MVFTPKQIDYDAKTTQRAQVAFACTPFEWQLLAAMGGNNSVSIKEIIGQKGIKNHYSTKALTELTAEHFMTWLIRVGLLRREVDGQGLTNSFRLTPLGREVLVQWQNREIPDTFSAKDRFFNNFRCWFNRFSL
ncbi:MAG: Npun_F0494 family protein [Limnothrix sp.]